MGLLDDLVTQFPPIKSDTSHYEAVGRFITGFAGAESSVHLMARKLSGMSDPKARIILGGMKLSQLMTVVRQMLKLDPPSEDISSDIESCLAQLNLISKNRHKLAHRSTIFFDGNLLVSNWSTAKSLGSWEHQVFDVPELCAMHSDCLRICWRLHRIAMPESECETVTLMGFLSEPWRYAPLVGKS